MMMKITQNRFVAASIGLMLLIAGGIGYVAAQVPGLFIASPTGLEQINVLVPSTGTLTTNPQTQTVTLNQIRNASGYTLVPTGTTVNTTVPNTSSKLLATGAITTWNVTFPLAPYDGEMLAVACPGGTATVAMTATAPSGVTVVGTAFTACTSGGVGANTAEWEYSLSANVWYRIQ
jgi:hypothetical protein